MVINKTSIVNKLLQNQIVYKKKINEISIFEKFIEDETLKKFKSIIVLNQYSEDLLKNLMKYLIVYLAFFYWFTQLEKYIRYLKNLKYPKNFLDFIYFILDLLQSLIHFFLFTLSLTLMIGLLNYQEFLIPILEIVLDTLFSNSNLIIISKISLDAKKIIIKNLINDIELMKEKNTTAEITMKALTKAIKLLKNKNKKCSLENNSYLKLIDKYKTQITGFELKNIDFITILKYIFQAAKYHAFLGNPSWLKFMRRLLKGFDLQSIEIGYNFDAIKHTLIQMYFGTEDDNENDNNENDNNEGNE